jgi:hypothetical protein
VDPVEVILHNGLSGRRSCPAVLQVRNDCEGARECIEFRMRWFGTPPGLEAEAHLNYAEAEQLVVALTRALAERRGVDLIDERAEKCASDVGPPAETAGQPAVDHSHKE